MRLGTYAVERDYSQYVQRASEIVFAVVGTATKGPINEPTVCTSKQDLINKFGDLDPNCMGLYAAQYFLNQASKLYYVRAASESARPSILNIKGTLADSSITTEAITFESKTPSDYTNKYKVVIEVPDPDIFIFNLSVVDINRGITLEKFLNISYDDLLKREGTGALETNKDAIQSNYIVLSSVTSPDINGEVLQNISEGTYYFSDGDNGISDITIADYIDAGKLLANDNIDMNLFAIPGVSDSAVIVDMLQLAENRGDSLFLVDPPNHLDANEVTAWHNGEGDYNDHVRFNSSYGALYWSWQKIYDSVNKIHIEVPPSVVVAPVIARSAQTSEIWYAPAGLQRGLVYGVLSPVLAPDSNTRDVLYSGQNNINSIVTDPQVGICVFGQKTLYRQATALDRVNVRMLLNYLKRIITAACRSLTFEPNDRLTWNNFEDRIEPTLRNIKNHRGLYEYQIVKGEKIVTEDDIDNYRMPCMILIRPTKAAEEIPIYFTLTSTGANFNDVLEASGIVVENY